MDGKSDFRYEIFLQPLVLSISNLVYDLCKHKRDQRSDMIADFCYCGHICIYLQSFIYFFTFIKTFLNWDLPRLFSPDETVVVRGCESDEPDVDEDVLVKFGCSFSILI